MNNNESEIKSWLEVALAKEEIQNLSVKVVGNSEKGNGYAGDVIFVVVTGTDKLGSKKVYDLVLKCNKLSEAVTTQDVFLNEIYVYEKMFPTFKQFQLSKGIDNPFSSVPKCYGTFTNDKRQVIVLENLKTAGYSLWSNKKPWTKEHIDFVVREYGKFHAVSVAMREQQPESFQKLSEPLIDAYGRFLETPSAIEMFEKLVQEAHDMLRNDLEASVLQKWLNFKKQVQFTFSHMIKNIDGLKVIVHGDCWSNNFMYQKGNDDGLLKIAMLDWQITKLSTPILDLSYFLFSCISEEDVSSMEVILKSYYNSFSSYLTMLGSSFASEYSFEQLLAEWKTYSRIGLLMAMLPLKISYAENDQIPDIAESAEKGEDVANAFMVDIKDKTSFKNRMKPLVEHAVEFGLVL